MDAWDKRLITSIYNKYEGSWVRKAAIIVSFFGDPKLWIPTLVVFGVYGIIIEDFSLFVVFATGFFQSYAIYYVIKHFIVKRQRPYKQDDDIVNLDVTGYGHSFPSGHVHHSSILMGLLWLQFFPVWWALPLLVVYNGLVGYSRLVSGCHYASDTFFAIFESYPELFFHWFVTAPLYLQIYDYFVSIIPF